MTEKLPIEETKELVKFVCDLCFAGVFAYEDGRFDISDLKHFLDIWEGIIPAFHNISGVPAELEDLSATEMDELVDVIIKELDEGMKREEALFVAKKALTAIRAFYDAYLAIRGLHADA